MSSSRILGIVLIGIGVLFLLDTTGIIDAWHIIATWWPIALIALGVQHILRKPQSLIAGLFLIALGCLLLANSLIVDFDFWAAAAPVILIVLGIGIILRPSRRASVQPLLSVMFAQRRQTLRDEVIDITALFGSAEHSINSNSFRGGTVQALFSSVELDLRNAQMATNEASLDVEVTFSSVEIRVPSTWRVVIHGSPVLGSIENKVLISQEPSSYVLNVRATVVGGSLEVV